LTLHTHKKSKVERKSIAGVPEESPDHGRGETYVVPFEQGEVTVSGFDEKGMPKAED